MTEMKFNIDFNACIGVPEKVFFNCDCGHHITLTVRPNGKEQRVKCGKCGKSYIVEVETLETLGEES